MWGASHPATTEMIGAIRAAVFDCPDGKIPAATLPLALLMILSSYFSINLRKIRKNERFGRFGNAGR
jgi:hypothetical protein